MAKRAAAKEKPGGGKWVFLAVLAVAGLVVIAGAVLARGQIGDRWQAAGMKRLSVLVDRMDELSAAWQKRKVIESPAPVRPESKPAPVREKPLPVEPASSPEPPSTPSPEPSTAPSPAPPDNITVEDQEKLRDLLKQINSP